MPLHPDKPRMGTCFDGLNKRIQIPRDHTDSFSKAVDCLMVKTVDPPPVAIHGLSKMTI